MAIIKLKRALLGMALMLFPYVSLDVSLAFADSKVDDFEGGTSQNYFENYWYYYDDNGGTKQEDRPQKAPDSKPSVINVPYGFKNRYQCGNMKDTFKIKDYKFLIKEEGGNKYGSMPFTYGDAWECTGYTAQPFIGIGTELVPNGDSLDLTGATSVAFRIRSHVNSLKVNFRIETMDIIRDSSFAFYFYQVTAPMNQWAACTVDIAKLAQPSWAKGEQQKTSLAQKLCAKLAWEVHGESNTGVKFDTLDIDDIVIKGYNFVSPTQWTKAAAAPPTSGIFSTFEVAPKEKTPLETYWYAYDDNSIGGNSQVIQGAEKDPATGLLTLNWLNGTGYNNRHTGAAVKIQLGKTMRRANAPGDTVDVQGFVGMGFNVYDSVGAVYFNATTGKMGANGGQGSASSIYFEYLADGDFRNMTLEVSDSCDVPDKNQPTRKDTRGPGIVWFRNLPLTGPNTWKAVEIPFDSLVSHSTWKGYVAIPLKKTALAKIQFKAQGAEGKGGTIMIDNVYFPGILFNGIQPEHVRNSDGRLVQRSVFNGLYRSGKVWVSWSPRANFSSGKISLIDSKGTVVMSDRIVAPAFSVNLAAEKVPTGLYFIQLNGFDTSGKSIILRSAITILK
jgi:hypothetical protein